MVSLPRIALSGSLPSHDFQFAFNSSDAVLNEFARFACTTGDARQYRELKPRLENRMSSVVWTDKTSFEGCNKEFDSDR